MNTNISSTKFSLSGRFLLSVLVFGNGPSKTFEILGYYSWRNTVRGSWFIEALCKELEESAYKYDILTILTSVNRRVAIDYESYLPSDPEMHERKQIPCFNSRLTRLVHFNKKG